MQEARRRDKRELELRFTEEKGQHQLNDIDNSLGHHVVEYLRLSPRRWPGDGRQPNSHCQS